MSIASKRASTSKRPYQYSFLSFLSWQSILVCCKIMLSQILRQVRSSPRQFSEISALSSSRSCQKTCKVTYGSSSTDLSQSWSSSRIRRAFQLAPVESLSSGTDLIQSIARFLIAENRSLIEMQSGFKACLSLARSSIGLLKSSFKSFLRRYCDPSIASTDYEPYCKALVLSK